MYVCSVMINGTAAAVAAAAVLNPLITAQVQEEPANPNPNPNPLLPQQQQQQQQQQMTTVQPIANIFDTEEEIAARITAMDGERLITDPDMKNHTEYV